MTHPQSVAHIARRRNEWSVPCDILRVVSTAQRDAARHVRELLRRRSLAQLCELLDPFDSTWAGVLYDAAETTLISGDPLSSESIAPFVLDGRTYNSVWCFYQSLKPPPGDTRGQEAAAGRRRRLRGGGRTALGRFMPFALMVLRFKLFPP